MPPFESGQIISYREMCDAEESSLQAGMNFRLNRGVSVLLMSVRKGAPYNDRTEEDGHVLIYEGHDARKSSEAPDPKLVDQPPTTPTGRKTQNGRFYDAAIAHRDRDAPAEIVRVYQKLMAGIWVFNGLFRLVDAWREEIAGRFVFKFKLEIVSPEAAVDWKVSGSNLEHNRVIPSAVKLQVFKRDRGRCVMCGATDNLHFDHDFPFSRGGSSLVAENIRILCARHNLAKGAKIQ